ncbi:MAG: cupin domain-containing protein [Methanobacteriota archaeon]|nr:MAG: cupin domain-containing protein [Euryarchaeota archaeon]
MYRTNIRSLKAVRFGEIGATRVLMKQLAGREDGAEKTALHEIRIQKGGRTSVHRHNWQHQIFVTSGRGTLTLGGRETRLKAGDVLVIGRGEEHGFEQRGRAPFVFLTVTPL